MKAHSIEVAECLRRGLCHGEQLYSPRIVLVQPPFLGGRKMAVAGVLRGEDITLHGG
jgi:hypothetical protein